MRFRVQLDMFAGPLDLLWYLVRKQELDILDIPIARVTDQYLEMLTVLEVIDVNAVGDFLELATRLMEIKSRLMLPRHEEEQETEEQVEDPRHDIVQRLLEYKKYKDAASMLAERGQLWQQRFARRANDMPTGGVDPAEQPIHEVELWDLVSAFARVVRDNAAARAGGAAGSLWRDHDFDQDRGRGGSGARSGGVAGFCRTFPLAASPLTMGNSPPHRTAAPHDRKRTLSNAGS
jgi:segregation and condensation protein A